jgi:hypothetical protein
MVAGIATAFLKTKKPVATVLRLAFKCLRNWCAGCLLVALGADFAVFGGCYATWVCALFAGFLGFVAAGTCCEFWLVSGECGEGCSHGSQCEDAECFFHGCIII